MLSKAFVDHFLGGGHSVLLFDGLARHCRQHQLAWDCGAGSDQAAVSLTQHFLRVVATVLQPSFLRGGCSSQALGQLATVVTGRHGEPKLNGLFR